MIAMNVDVVLILSMGNGTIACVCIALSITYATAINWATMTPPVLMVY